MSVGDINADGFEDVFWTGGMGSNFRYGINGVLINDGGEHFHDSEYLVGIEPRLNGRMQKTGFVLECDGIDQEHSLCAGLTGRHRVREALSSRSSVFLDIDSDGDLDLITNEMNDRPQVFVSDLTDQKAINFVKVALVGTTSNRDALGALVRVKAGGKTLMQRNDGNTSYLGQSLAPLYFGLGDSSDN